MAPFKTVRSLWHAVIALTAIFNSGLRPGIQYKKTLYSQNGVSWIPGLSPELKIAVKAMTACHRLLTVLNGLLFIIQN